MSRIPRILPLAGVAVLGVLAINALAGADSVGKLFSGAKAFAEGTGGDKAAPKAGAPANCPTVPTAAPVCAPTAAELAKEAGLSPAELDVLQKLGARRGQLDQREQDIDVQLQLLAVAESKLDAKVKALGGLKTDIQALLGQADQQQQQEAVRMIAVFSAMKPKDAAARMMVLDDSVRLPIAAGMKERILAGVLAQMPPMEAKKLTEALARRYAASPVLKAGQQALTEPAAAPTPPPAQAVAEPIAGAPKPVKTAAAKPRPARPAPKPAAKPKPAATQATADAKPSTPAATPPATAAPPAKAG